jgi:PAS domain S-box-containing protein
MSSREQLSDLHAVFDEAPVPYVVTDRDLTITDANRAAQQFWGISLSGLVGQPLDVIVAPSDSLAFSRVVEEILQAPDPVTRPMRLRSAAGKETEVILAARVRRNERDDPVSVYWLFSMAPPRGGSDLA